MFTVKVTAEKLHELRMLTDWQLRQLGFDPDSVTTAMWIRCYSGLVNLADVVRIDVDVEAGDNPRVAAFVYYRAGGSVQLTGWGTAAEAVEYIDWLWSQIQGVDIRPLHTL